MVSGLHASSIRNFRYQPRTKAGGVFSELRHGRLRPRRLRGLPAGAREGRDVGEHERPDARRRAGPLESEEETQPAHAEEKASRRAASVRRYKPFITADRWQKRDTVPASVSGVQKTTRCCARSTRTNRLLQSPSDCDEPCIASTRALTSLGRGRVPSISRLRPRVGFAAATTSAPRSASRPATCRRTKACAVLVGPSAACARRNSSAGRSRTPGSRSEARGSSTVMFIARCPTCETCRGRVIGRWNIAACGSTRTGRSRKVTSSSFATATRQTSASTTLS